MRYGIRAQHDGENLWLVEGGTTVVGDAQNITVAPDDAFMTDDATLAARIAAEATANLERQFAVIELTGDPDTFARERTTHGA